MGADCLMGRASLLILLQRTEGKNDKEKERRKGELSGEKGEEQRGEEKCQGKGREGQGNSCQFLGRDA